MCPITELLRKNISVHIDYKLEIRNKTHFFIYDNKFENTEAKWLRFCLILNVLMTTHDFLGHIDNTIYWMKHTVHLVLLTQNSKYNITGIQTAFKMSVTV